MNEDCVHIHAQIKAMVVNNPHEKRQSCLSFTTTLLLHFELTIRLYLLDWKLCTFLNFCMRLIAFRIIITRKKLSPVLPMLAKNNKVMNVQKRINAFLVNYFPIEANKQKSFIFVLVML